MNKNGSFKKKRVKFSQVSNEVLRNSELSLKVKGLYSLIQSYITLDNFVLYKSTLKKQCKEGNKAFEAAWKELKDYGYLVQERHSDESGHFYYIYDLLDEIHHTPKKEGTVKGVCGKGGIYNNTDPNNTDPNNTKSFIGNEPKISFNKFLKSNDLSQTDDAEAMEAIQYYDECYTNVFNTELKYTVNEWENILEGIFDNDTGSDADLEILKDAIDKHFETKYKHKEMYLLHNFTGKVKDNKLYEAGIL